MTLLEPWLDRNSRVFDFALDLHGFCNSGVDLFFVISGFLIYGALIKSRRPFAPYMLRRIQRIYPTATVVLGIYLAASVAFPERSKLPEDGTLLLVIQNALLLPGLFPIEAINPVSWSLSYEMAFYAALPFIIQALRLRRLGTGARIATLVALCVGIWSLCAWFGGPIRFVGFAAGMLVREMLSSIPAKSLRKGEAPAIFLSGAILACVWEIRADPELVAVLHPWGGPIRFALLALGFMLLMMISLTPETAFSKMLSARPLRALGNISYSYYLIHGMALHAALLAFSRLAPPEQTWTHEFFLLMPLFFISTLPVALALFLTIERPFSLRSSVSERRAAHANA